MASTDRSRRWSIELTPVGLAGLRDIAPVRERREVARAIDTLAEQPTSKGKQLEQPLGWLRSLRAARDRYRILFEVDPSSRVVTVHFVGRRRPGEGRDVYAVAVRLLETLTRRRELTLRPAAFGATGAVVNSHPVAPWLSNPVPCRS